MRSKTDKNDHNAALNVTPVTTTTTTNTTTIVKASTRTTTYLNVESTKEHSCHCRSKDESSDTAFSLYYYQLKPAGSHQKQRYERSPTQLSSPVPLLISRCRRGRHSLLNLFANSLLLLPLLLVLWPTGGMRFTSAAPQSCILCDKEDLKAKDPGDTYEEFLFEHQVTRQDAINALKALNESFYQGSTPDNSCKSVTCTKKVMKYCLGPQFVNDHCWCELGHNEEGLPFVPHICYVGEKVYTASVGSCFFYEEVKECCCASALAKQWRHISVASSLFPNFVNLLCGAMLLLLQLHRLLRVVI